MRSCCIQFTHYPIQNVLHTVEQTQDYWINVKTANEDINSGGNASCREFNRNNSNMDSKWYCFHLQSFKCECISITYYPMWKRSLCSGGLESTTWADTFSAECRTCPLTLGTSFRFAVNIFGDQRQLFRKCNVQHKLRNIISNSSNSVSDKKRSTRSTIFRFPVPIRICSNVFFSAQR